MFERLIEELREDEKQKEKDSINQNLARIYSTEFRWNQYKNGDVSEAKYLEYARTRYNAGLRRKLKKNIAKAERIANAPNLHEIMIVCEFNRSHNVRCSADIFYSGGSEQTEGRACGYGYDKESSAIAEALNSSDSVLKALYQYKEIRLIQGYSDYSDMASDGHDNRDIIGYGAGYDILPYFEGAVGSECYWRIFEKMGFKTRANFSGKNCTFYHIYTNELEDKDRER